MLLHDLQAITHCWLLHQELEANASAQLRETSVENQSLKRELTRLEDRNNQLQGYGLDDMSADDLSNLIHGLTQVWCTALLCIEAPFTFLVTHEVCGEWAVTWLLPVQVLKCF